MSMSKQLSFYELGIQYQQLMSQLYDYETGEINQNVEEQIDALTPTIEKKCIAVTSWIKKMESDIQEIERIEHELKVRKNVYLEKISKAYKDLESNMERCGIKEVSCPYFTIRIKKNPYSTDILDESLIPKDFMKTREIVKTETKPDKNAIKEEVLKTGVQVPGALVQQKNKLEILIDKI